MNYTKEQLDYDIEHCLTAQTFARVGAYRVSFRPFENTLTEEEEIIKKKIERGDEAIESCYDDLLIFVEHLYSTVYHGYRWYFETPEKLKAFCQLVGQV